MADGLGFLAPGLVSEHALGDLRMHVHARREHRHVGAVLRMAGDGAGVDLIEIERDQQVALVGQEDLALMPPTVALTHHGESRVDDRDPAARLSSINAGVGAPVDSPVEDRPVDGPHAVEREHGVDQVEQFGVPAVGYQLLAQLEHEVLAE